MCEGEDVWGGVRERRRCAEEDVRGGGDARGRRPRSVDILPISRAVTFTLRSDCCRGCWPISAREMAHRGEAVLNGGCRRRVQN